MATFQAPYSFDVDCLLFYYKEELSLLPLYWPIHLFFSDQYRLRCFVLKYSMTVIIYSDPYIVSDLAWGSPFKLGPLSFWNVSIIFWELFGFLSQNAVSQNVPGSLYVPCSSPGIWHLSKKPGSF